MKILLMGLPGSGKTTLARDLAKRMKAIHWNADDVRANLNTHLGFSEEDRIEQARRMGFLCDRVVEAGHVAIADFVCPTLRTRTAFGPADVIIWMDTIKQGRYEDTNKMFVEPDKVDYRVTERDVQFWGKYIHEHLDYKHKPHWFKAFLLGLKD